jgi:site-specific recombinase XerD
VGHVRKIKPAYVAPTFAHAVETFLVAHTASDTWSVGTATKYHQTLAAFAVRLAGTRVSADVATLDTDLGAAVLAVAFGTTASTTQVQHLSTLHSALGGKTERVFRQTGAAMLLPRLLAGRTRAPVFLADPCPIRAVNNVDLCPVTGRARLSYRRATEIFEHTTQRLADPADQAQGWTLHQLRHAMLTQAENGTNTAALLARSRHASVRSLERYARPNPEAVAATEPAARRRSGQSH